MSFALYLRKFTATSVPEFVVRPWSMIRSISSLCPDDLPSLLHLLRLVQGRAINFDQFYVSLTQLSMFAELVNPDSIARLQKRKYRLLITWCRTSDTSPFHSNAPYSANFYLTYDRFDGTSPLEALASFLFDFFHKWGRIPVVRLGFVADAQRAHIGGIILFNRGGRFVFAAMMRWCRYKAPATMIYGWPVTAVGRNATLRNPVYLTLAFRAGRFVHVL
ncbi:hypothetical protein CONPUDRAFT_155530 [Coniophora puteana RWD-64-598 SS2]|uniref:Uncharacterized protein n=1 Tax=Coniophora puteana (strain RWD-64-598) TaxID=741705 RepID=A0A5M3MHU8_CONPW|nr:uncharacterized protein CONPUDRAFT_155530 [Coniophora puteana RWD-64-598 SS2]EIW78808.1 hypothetical protein CONPUDRAFT_155530 [Coniophora puteana RWD-64-598 SS2]